MKIEFNNKNEFVASELEIFKQTLKRDDIGFFSFLSQDNLSEDAKKLFSKHKNKKHFVQIGIGGSALGPQMLITSLQKNFNYSFSFLDNTDADYLKKQLAKISLTDSVFYIVSKSGGTAETIANFIIIRNLLSQEGVSEKDLGNYFVFCTDPKSGQLREFVDSNQLDSLQVPSSIGGRYSVLTDVGLFPALFAGIEIDDLLRHAKEYGESILDQPQEFFALAKYLYNLGREQNISQTVIMPYSSLLKDYSAWFVQLWAESLGKENKGLTPIPAVGATDQHSQMQLFMQGPNDKCLILIHVKNKSNNYSLKNNLCLESAQKLDAYNLNQLIESQFHGTCDALQEMQRPLVKIEIDELNEKYLAQLIIFAQFQTIIQAQYLNIDPFNQPGVELGKKLAFNYLKSL